jgi:hypothetical protein
VRGNDAIAIVTPPPLPGHNDGTRNSTKFNQMFWFMERMGECVATKREHSVRLPFMMNSVMEPSSILSTVSSTTGRSGTLKMCSIHQPVQHCVPTIVSPPNPILRSPADTLLERRGHRCAHAEISMGAFSWLELDLHPLVMSYDRSEDKPTGV